MSNEEANAKLKRWVNSSALLNGTEMEEAIKMSIKALENLFNITYYFVN